MKSIKLYVFLISVFLLYTGCNYSRQFGQKTICAQTLGKIAVLPFRNYSDNPCASLALTELFYTELCACEKFTVVPLHKVMDKIDDDYSDSCGSGELKKIASNVGADTVVLASVLEYRYKKGFRQRPVVGVNVRLICAKNGEVLWSQSVTREEFQFMFYKGSLSFVSQKICRQIVNKLTKYVR